MFASSVLALAVSAYVFLSGQPNFLNLAGTQWMLASILLGVYALLMQGWQSGASSCECKPEEKK